MSTQENVDQLVEVRTMWKDEALDFTPWLAGHIEILGEILGMTFEKNTETEVRVGPMRLDILAKEVNTGRLVAIENQLEWTNTLHLGQLVTYAAGCDVRVAIWIATEFRYEYAEALHWLNEWTLDDIEFYGVKIEVVKGADDAGLEPKFSKVVYPGFWDKALTLPPEAPMDPRAQRYHDFFQPLRDSLTGSGFANSARQIWGNSGRLFPSQFGGDTGYAGYFGESENKVWVVFHYRANDKEEASRVFQKLLEERRTIEGSIDAVQGEQWEWNEYEKFSFFTISLGREGSIDDPPETLASIRSWMHEGLMEFRKVFDPLMREIHSDH